MSLFLLGLVLFLATHLVPALVPSVKESLVASMGKNGYRGIHSVLSVATLVLLIYGFGEARAETGMLYYPPLFLKHITLTLMLVAIIILMTSFLPGGYIAAYAKHPMVLAVKIWAFAHLLANGETAQVILFASFLAWGIILRITYKRRERRGEIMPRAYKSWKYDVIAIVLGIAVYAAIVLKLHELLIGVPVLAM